MNRQPSIERVLDAWLSDGPRVMPDRLFDAVLDRVERVPQRRLARLSMRLTEMTPRLRLLTVATAGLVVALVGIYALSPKPIANVGGPSTAPTPTAAAAPTAAADVPMVLRELWIGPPKGIDGFDPEASLIATFSGNFDFYVSEAANNATHRYTSKIRILGPDRLELDSNGNVLDCGSSDVGTYRWAVSSSGRALTITSEGDACAARGRVVTGTYQLSKCPTADDNCFGPLDAGTHSSQFFDPFVPNGGDSLPRYGALEYTVPDGWTNIDDWPEYFGLGPDGAAGNPQIAFASEVLPVPDDDPCADRPSTTVGRTATALAHWVAGLDGLEVVTPLQRVTVGGLPAWRLDIRIAPGSTLKCPWNTGKKPDRPLFTDSIAGNDGFGWGIPTDSSMRLWLVDLGDGRALMIDFESETQASYDAWVDEATGVVESFVLNR